MSKPLERLAMKWAREIGEHLSALVKQRERERDEARKHGQPRE